METASTAAAGIAAGGSAASEGAYEPAVDHVICRAAGRLCAVPLGVVGEVMRALPIKVVAGAPVYVTGVSIIRGEPVPVVDLGMLVGNEPTVPGRLITVNAGPATIALAAEDVLGVWGVAAEELQRLPPLLRDAAGETVASIGALDAELLVVLGVARVVPAEVLARLEDCGVGS